MPMKCQVSSISEKLKELKHRIVHLFLYSYNSGRNRWNLRAAGTKSAGAFLNLFTDV
jgi:hypothetical protein